MKTNVLIIEDENLAIIRLKRILQEIDENFIIIAEIKSVKEGLEWFSQNDTKSIDVIFSDIQLLDGISFEIFEKITITIPIIFTTAYDDFLLKAFKTQGIEYLLKPFSKEELKVAINKYKTLQKDFNRSYNFTDFTQNFAPKSIEVTHFPTFISYNKDKIFPIKSEDIAFLILSNQNVYAFTEKSKWLIAENLNHIQEKLPSYHFYRANRQMIIQRKNIKEIQNYFNGRLKILLNIPTDDILISKDNCKSFKDWLQK